MRKHTSNGTWRDLSSLGAVMVIGLALAISAFVAVRGHYQNLDRQQFRRNAASYSTSFKDDVVRHVTSLAAIRAFVSASKSVTRWEFSAYAGQILPQNPGFRAVLWVPAVTVKARRSYEASLQEDGLYGLSIRELTEDGQIVAAGLRGAYLPITFVEPFDGNDKLVGLDLSGLPRFADIFRAAQKTGQVAASAPLSQTLVAGTRGPAVLLVFPLRPATATTADDAAGAPAPQGYALGVLQLQTLIAAASGSSGAPLEAGIAYPAGGPAQALVSAAGTGAHRMTSEDWFKPAEFHQAVPFDIADRHFQLVLRSVGSADPVTRLYVPLGAALLVIAFTALLVQNMSTTILRKRLVERAVVARTSELRAANESLHDEVVQRRQAEAELRIARDKAQSASRAKSAFMAVMTHELRTPLNAVIGFSSILNQSEHCPQTQRCDYAGEILGNGRRLLGLVNDILDLTQMDSAPAAQADALVYLPECIAMILEDAQPAAQRAGVGLKASVADHLPTLYGDSKRLSRALAHLVSNAVKFTPQGGAAVIAARTGPQRSVIVEVLDSGVGMSPAAQQTIRTVFSRKEVFAQYDGLLGRKYDGVGLGLTYVGKVAELHGAALDLISAPGQGTCIRLTFHHERIVGDLEVA